MPTRSAIERAIEQYPYEITGPVSVKLVSVDSLKPTEEISDRIERRLLDQVEMRPSSVPPILTHGKKIADGHHRWVAEREFYDKVWIIDLLR